MGDARFAHRTYRLERLDAVASTNTMVKDAIRAGEPEGLVVGALRQTAGYGRQGRTWESPYGGLYQSFLLRPHVPASDMPTVALMAALAVRDAMTGLLDSMQGDDADAQMPFAIAATADSPAKTIQVKWPNDVVRVDARGDELDAAASSDASDGNSDMVPDTRDDKLRKLCGISSEAVGGALCIGIGVNVFVPQNAIEFQGKNAPAYLSDYFENAPHLVSPEGLSEGQRIVLATLSELLATCLFARYEQWRSGGFLSLASEYRACSALVGALVDIVSLSGAPLASGVVHGIDDEGRLLLVEKSGMLHAVSSGEAHIKRIGD